MQWSKVLVPPSSLHRALCLLFFKIMHDILLCVCFIRLLEKVSITPKICATCATYWKCCMIKCFLWQRFSLKSSPTESSQEAKWWSLYFLYFLPLFCVLFFFYLSHSSILRHPLKSQVPSAVFIFLPPSYILTGLKLPETAASGVPSTDCITSLA